MMRSEHHTGMHSFHNILISKSALISLNNCKEKFTFFPKQNKSKQQKNAFCYTFNVRTIISTNNIQRVQLEGDMVMLHTLVDKGMPFSIKPTLNSLKPTFFFALAPSMRHTDS